MGIIKSSEGICNQGISAHFHFNFGGKLLDIRSEITFYGSANASP